MLIRGINTAFSATGKMEAKLVIRGIKLYNPSRDEVLLEAAWYLDKTPFELGKLSLGKYMELYRFRCAGDLVMKNGPQNLSDFCHGYLFTLSVLKHLKTHRKIGDDTLLKNFLPDLHIVTVEEALKKFPHNIETPLLRRWVMTKMNFCRAA